MKGYHDPAYPELKSAYQKLMKQASSKPYDHFLYYKAAHLAYESGNPVLIKHFETETKQWLSILECEPKAYYYDATNLRSLFKRAQYTWVKSTTLTREEIVSNYRNKTRRMRRFGRYAYGTELIDVRDNWLLTVEAPITKSNIGLLVDLVSSFNLTIRLVNHYPFEPCFPLLTTRLCPKSVGYKRYQYKLLEYMWLMYEALDPLCYDIKRIIRHLTHSSFWYLA